MSNLENIQKKILSDAHSEVEALQTRAKEELDGLLEKEAKRTKEETDEILREAKERAEQVRERARNASKIEARDVVLKTKQDILVEMKETVKEKLKAMDDHSFKSFLEKIVPPNEREGSTLVLPLKRSALKESFSEATFEDMEDGFYLRKGAVTMNFSFQKLVEEVMDDMEGEIVQKLFGEA
ncbi:V-type ATP synthase subunit E [Guggenheimella bovis]